jgi:hypothetical protein
MSTAVDRLLTGPLHGVCVRCEQLLTRPESIAVGCGEICAEHLGTTYPGHRQPGEPERHPT